MIQIYSILDLENKHLKNVLLKQQVLKGANDLADEDIDNKLR